MSVACKKSPSVNQSCGPILQRPGPSGHRSDLSGNNTGSDSLSGSAKVQETQKQGGGAEKKEEKKPALFCISSIVTLIAHFKRRAEHF